MIVRIAAAALAAAVLVGVSPAVADATSDGETSTRADYEG